MPYVGNNYIFSVWCETHRYQCYKSCASPWLMLYEYIMMHSPQKVKLIKSPNSDL